MLGRGVGLHLEIAAPSRLASVPPLRLQLPHGAVSSSHKASGRLLEGIIEHLLQAGPASAHAYIERLLHTGPCQRWSCHRAALGGLLLDGQAQCSAALCKRLV